MFRITSRSAICIALAVLSVPGGVSVAQGQSSIDTGVATDPLTPGQISALEADLGRIGAEIAEAEKLANAQGQSLVGALSSARVQQLLLTRSMVENRLRAAKGEATIEIVVPVHEPDPVLAAQIKTQMAAAEAEIAAAKTEAARYSGGLVLAMILTREETARLQLAQLQSSLYEAEFGIAMTAQGVRKAASGSGAVDAGSSVVSDVAAQPGSSIDVPVPEVVAWADPDHPEIDYSLEPFASLAAEGMRFAGYWAIKEEKAAIDDSLKVVAINVTTWGGTAFGNKSSLIMQCVEGTTALVYRTGDFLMSDYDSQQLPAIYRIDDAKSVSARWSTLTDNQGAGVFGAQATQLIRQLLPARKFFIRLTETNSQNHDALFQLAGMEETKAVVSGACGWN